MSWSFSEMPLSGWGRYPRATCSVVRPERYADFLPDQGSLIARGLGRSYGDAALNTDGHVVATERLHRILSFDPETGILEAEAGVTLDELFTLFVPRGWFLPVTPGTRFVTLGGAAAADVHGKNHHHDGSFGDHVLELEVIRADGQRVRCSPRVESPLFWATIGGMGLTGLIGTVTLRLRRIASAYMTVQHRRAPDVEAAFRMLDDPACDDEYSVAWIDCLARGAGLGRSIVMTGHHAPVEELPPALRASPLTPPPRRARSIPVDFPGWVLNPLAIGWFNRFYYSWQGRRTSPFLSDYRSYFHPLDGIGGWNRMYGKRGFVQYQCVLPEPGALIGMTAILERLAGSRRASFLAVLKRFGAGNPGYLSFPIAGYTLALDLPLTRPDELFALLAQLDGIVQRAGGRVYLAKDACLSPAMFRAMYPRFDEWSAVKAQVDPHHRFRSLLSERLAIGEAACLPS